MNEQLIEFIDTYDIDICMVTKGFASCSGRHMRKRRGYTSPNGAKTKRYQKRMAHKQHRKYFRALVMGRKTPIRFLTARDVI